jgi:hypothetical protein
MTNSEIATTNALLSDRASASKSGVEGRKSGGKPPHSKNRPAGSPLYLLPVIPLDSNAG